MTKNDRRGIPADAAGPMVEPAIPVAGTVNSTNVPRRRNTGRYNSSMAAQDAGTVTAGTYRSHLPLQ